MATVPQSTSEILYPGRKVSPAGRLTEEEFLNWCDEDTKAEWVDGQVILMSPANIQHILVSDFLHRVLAEFVDHHRLGQTFHADLMIRVIGGRLRVPDLSFVANDRLSIIDEQLCAGAPDLLVEVVSPDSIERDWQVKYAEYAAASAAEYWIVDPLQDRLAAFTLSGGKRYSPIAECDGKVASLVVPGFYLRQAWLFGDELPRVDEVLRELGVRA